MKALLVSSSKSKNKPLIRMFKPLSDAFELSTISSDAMLASSFSGGAKMSFGPAAGSWGDLLFIPFVALAWPFYWSWFFYRSFKMKPSTLVCCEVNEKIFLTLPAKLLGLKVLWLEMPNRIRNPWSPSSWALLVFSRMVSVAALSSATLNALLSVGYHKDSLSFLPPAGEWDYARQDDLFSELAVSEKPKFFFKSFTIGTVVDFSNRGYFESLLKAVKNCSNIIPNIRLVVIGSGNERRGLNWLSKKLGIERKVWFVGEQEDLVKWFDSFDLFFSLSGNPNLFDMEMVLLAMSRGVPAAVFKHKLFDDFVVDGDTGIVIDSGSAELIGKKLIDLESDKESLKAIGDSGKELAEGRFNRANQSKILSNLMIKKI